MKKKDKDPDQKHQLRERQFSFYLLWICVAMNAGLFFTSIILFILGKFSECACIVVIGMLNGKVSLTCFKLWHEVKPSIEDHGDRPK